MSHRKTLDCLPLLEPYSKHFRQFSAAECQKHWTSGIPFTRRCCMRDYAACMFCVPSQELQPVSVVDTSNTRCNTFPRRNQNQPTRQSQWNGAEHANSIVHVQTLIIEDQINVSLEQQLPEKQSGSTHQTESEGWTRTCQWHCACTDADHRRPYQC